MVDIFKINTRLKRTGNRQNGTTELSVF